MYNSEALWYRQHRFGVFYCWLKEGKIYKIFIVELHQFKLNETKLNDDILQ